MEYFTPLGERYRIECRETGETLDADTLDECREFAARGRQLMPDEPLSFRILRIAEWEADI